MVKNFYLCGHPAPGTRNDLMAFDECMLDNRGKCIKTGGQRARMIRLIAILAPPGYLR